MPPPMGQDSPQRGEMSPKVTERGEVRWLPEGQTEGAADENLSIAAPSVTAVGGDSSPKGGAKGSQPPNKTQQILPYLPKGEKNHVC